MRRRNGNASANSAHAFGTTFRCQLPSVL
ncbi:MAG: hypothetical protein ACLUVG_09285 [Phocaeicola vulgatus]